MDVTNLITSPTTTAQDNLKEQLDIQIQPIVDCCLENIYTNRRKSKDYEKDVQKLYFYQKLVALFVAIRYRFNPVSQCDQNSLVSYWCLSKIKKELECEYSDFTTYPYFYSMLFATNDLPDFNELQSGPVFLFNAGGYDFCTDDILWQDGTNLQWQGRVNCINN